MWRYMSIIRRRQLLLSSINLSDLLAYILKLPFNTNFSWLLRWNKLRLRPPLRRWPSCDPEYDSIIDGLIKQGGAHCISRSVPVAFTDGLSIFRMQWSSTVLSPSLPTIFKIGKTSMWWTALKGQLNYLQTHLRRDFRSRPKKFRGQPDRAISPSACLNTPRRVDLRLILELK